MQADFVLHQGSESRTVNQDQYDSGHCFCKNSCAHEAQVTHEKNVVTATYVPSGFKMSSRSACPVEILISIYEDEGWSGARQQ